MLSSSGESPPERTQSLSAIRTTSRQMPKTAKSTDSGDPAKAGSMPVVKTKITHYYNLRSQCPNQANPQCEHRNPGDLHNNRTHPVNNRTHPVDNRTHQVDNTPHPTGKRGKSLDNFLTIVKQINMQKKKSACRTFFQELKSNEILLGQEPYFHKNKLVSVPNSHKPFTPFSKDTPRVCILLPRELGNISYSMSPFCNRDMITIRCNLKNRKDTILCSIYMGHEPNKPEIDLNTVEKMSKLVDFTKSKNIPLIMGADSNGHHILWNSFKKNDRRGIFLAQLMEELNLSVANQGKNPTFQNSRGHKSIVNRGYPVNCSFIQWPVEQLLLKHLK